MNPSKTGSQRCSIADAARSLGIGAECALAPQKILRFSRAGHGRDCRILVVLDPSTDQLVFEVIEGGGRGGLEQTTVGRDQGVAGWVATHCEPVVVDDVTTDERFYAGIDRVSSFLQKNCYVSP